MAEGTRESSCLKSWDRWMSTLKTKVLFCTYLQIYFVWKFFLTHQNICKVITIDRWRSLLWEIKSKLAYIAFLYCKYSCLWDWPFFLSCFIVTTSFFICIWKVSGKLTMNVCSCGMCSPIARALSTFTSLGAVLPFMMFIWCSCSEEMGFIFFFSSSLILNLFLSLTSNLLLLSDLSLWAAFFSLSLFTRTELQRLWDRIH